MRMLLILYAAQFSVFLPFVIARRPQRAVRRNSLAAIGACAQGRSTETRER